MADVVLAPIHTRLLRTWTLLANSAVQSAHTGNTSETTLATVTVPAGEMGPNGILRIWTIWSYTNNANTKTLRAKFGGTTFQQFARTTTAMDQLMLIIRNRNAANSQVSAALAFVGLGNSTTAIVTAAIDTSSAQNIEFTGQLGNAADQVALEGYSVELLYGA